MKKLSIFSLLFFALTIIPAFAHVEEGIAPPVLVQAIWSIHSWTHWLVWIFFIYSCYYFRYYIGRKLGHPSGCMVSENGRGYFPEGNLKIFHRTFVWIMIVWTAIHLSELAGGLFGYAELPVYSLGELIPGEEIWEWIYVGATFLFLSSCHYTRFVASSGRKCFSCLPFGKERHKIFSIQSTLNNYHAHFFWIAIAASALVLLSGGHL